MIRKIDELTEHPVNVRIYGNEEIPESFLESIKTKGILVPITITPENVIISGHRRWQSAKIAGLETVPVVIAEFKNEIEEREAILEHNRQREKTFSQLMSEADEIELIEKEKARERMTSGINQYSPMPILAQGESGSTRDKVSERIGMKKSLYSTGRTIWKEAQSGNEKANELIKAIDEKEKTISGGHRELKVYTEVENFKTIKEMSEPVILEKKNIYNVKFGDVWTCGKHKVICGDSYDVIKNYQATALMTDPPYGISYKPEWKKWDGGKSDFMEIEGDGKEFNPESFMNYPTVFFFGANYFSNKLPLGGWLCWDKRTKEELDAMFGAPFELGWFKSESTTSKSIMVRVLHGGVVNSDSENGNNEKRHHPTQKPIAVMVDVIKKLTSEDDIVIDPFAGSGTTLLACNRLNRKSISIEFDPSYVSIILQRYEKETGEKPCLE